MIELVASSILLAIGLVRDCCTRNLIFVYGTIGLWCICLGRHPRRVWTSLPLGLLLVWSLLVIFLRGWQVAPYSIVMRYLNVYLLSEGFIYLFCGAILLKIIVEHSRTYVLYIPVLLISLWQLFTVDNFYLRMTMPMAFMLSLGCFAAVNKRWRWLPYAAPPALLLLLKYLPNLRYGLVARRLIWLDMLGDIGLKPVIGRGFNDTLLPSTMTWVEAGNYGYLFAHNDYLCLGKCVGILGMVFALWFACECLWKLRNKPLVILPMTFIITSFFQSTMFDVHKASIFILVLAMAFLSERTYSISVSNQKGRLKEIRWQRES